MSKFSVEIIKEYKLDSAEENKRLLSMYEPACNSMDCYREHKAPYFLSVDETFNKSNFRIMIFGQDTNGWGNEFANISGKPSPEDLMKLYGRVVNEDWGTGSMFWQFYSAIRENFKETPNVSVIANNLRKNICEDESNQVAADREIELIKSEISIIKPDFYLSTTGVKSVFENRIRSVFGDFEERMIDDSVHLSQLIFDDYNIKFYRCDHPIRINVASKQRQKWNEVVNILLNEIVQAIANRKLALCKSSASLPSASSAATARC